MVTFLSKNLKKSVYLVLGCALMGFATGQFMLPNQISTGGFTGIGTILYYIFGINIGLSTIVLNLPFFLFAYKKLGKFFVFKAILGTVILSFFQSFFEKFSALTTDSFLACIYGGILIGLGSSLVFKAEASTGGSDLIMSIVRSFRPTVKSSTVIILIDVVIVLINMLVFKTVEIGLYSAIAIYIMGKVIDIVFEGIDFSKVIYIVSDSYEVIATKIKEDVKRGVTALYGKGMYTGEEKNILLCVVNRREVAHIRNIVKNIDDKAFLIILNAREVFGKGFK